VHCSRVFRSNVPSDVLPSSPGGRPSGAGQGECGSTRPMEWGVGSGGGVSRPGCCPAAISSAGHIQEDTLPGPVRSQGRVARCVIQDWPHVLGAPRRAWNQHENDGARHGLAVAPGAGQVTQQLASWLPASPSAADQPPASV